MSIIDVLSQPKLGHNREILPVAAAVVEDDAAAVVEDDASEVVEVCMSVTEVGSRDG